MSNVITAWSHSRLRDFESCPKKFEFKHIQKIKEETSPALERGKVIHDRLSKYLKGEVDLHPDHEFWRSELDYMKLKKAESELKLGFYNDWSEATFFAKKVWLRIVADALHAEDGNVVCIVDFKTGKYKPEDNIDQLELYAAAAFHLYKEAVGVNVKLMYIDHNKTYVKSYTKEDGGKFEANFEQRVSILFNTEEFVTRPGDACRWCSFKKESGGPCVY